MYTAEDYCRNVEHLIERWNVKGLTGLSEKAMEAQVRRLPASRRPPPPAHLSGTSCSRNAWPVQLSVGGRDTPCPPLSRPSHPPHCTCTLPPVCPHPTTAIPQEFVCALPAKVRRLAEIKDMRKKKAPKTAVQFDWIFDRKVAV